MEHKQQSCWLWSFCRWVRLHYMYVFLLGVLNIVFSFEWVFAAPPPPPPPSPSYAMHAAAIHTYAANLRVWFRWLMHESNNYLTNTNIKIGRHVERSIRTSRRGKKRIARILDCKQWVWQPAGGGDTRVRRTLNCKQCVWDPAGGATNSSVQFIYDPRSEISQVERKKYISSELY